MLNKESRIKIVDNSGATEALCIQILGGTKRKYASVGDIVSVTIKQAKPGGEVKKKEVCRAVIVGTKKNISRPNGTYLRFDQNMGVIIDEKGELRATRIFVPVARELRKKFPKIVSLAPETV